MAKARQQSPAAKARSLRKVSKKVWDNVPPVQEVTLYWVDERVRAAKRTKIHPIHGHKPTQVSVPRGTLFSPGVASMETRDVAALLVWVKAMLAQGWINEVDLQERQTLMRRLIRAQKAQAFAAPDPAKTAGVKKSGKGEKGSRKPVRDYRAPASVKNNGTIVSRTINGFKQVV